MASNREAQSLVGCLFCQECGYGGHDKARLAKEIDDALCFLRQENERLVNMADSTSRRDQAVKGELDRVTDAISSITSMLNQDLIENRVPCVSARVEAENKADQLLEKTLQQSSRIRVLEDALCLAKSEIVNMEENVKSGKPGFSCDVMDQIDAALGNEGGLKEICEDIGCSGMTSKCPGDPSCSILRKIVG